MNYTDDVKREIYAQVLSESYDKKLSYLTGVTKSLAQINAFKKDDEILTYEIKDAALANVVSNLLIELFNIEHEIEYVNIDPKMYVITLFGDKANSMLKSMHLSHYEGDKFVEMANSSHIEKISNMEKAEGYLQGIFSALGSVYYPHIDENLEKKDRGYHLEIIFLEKEHALSTQTMLEECKIPLTYIERESTFALYSKNSERISDVLAFLGASNAVLQLNNISAQLYMNNEINRVSNIEAANMDKVAIANAKYIEAIEQIDKKIGIKHIQDEKIRLVCDERLKDKLSSLSALATKLNMTKSSLNRIFAKILKLRDSLEDK